MLESIPRPPPVTLGQHLRAAREAAGLNMGDVAERLRCSVVVISDTERGKLIPVVGFVSDFARHVGADVEEMLALRAAALPVRVARLLEDIDRLSDEDRAELLRRLKL